MNTNTQTSCPATGRTATWCLDQTHTACYAGAREGVKIDRQVEAEFRSLDESY